MNTLHATDSQLAALRTEARKSGRATLAGLCTLALDGDEWAKAEALSDRWAAKAMGQIRGER